MAENETRLEEWRGLADSALIARAARAAGEISLKYFKSANQVWYKSGNSPVSEADHAVDRFLREVFQAARPDYGWLSEETEDDRERLSRQKVLVVDPIDGTRGFLDGRREWCVSIAIVEAGRPIEAVLHCPALTRTFQASAGLGASENGTPIQTRKLPEALRITGSKKLIERMQAQFGEELDVVEFIPSLALRIALVACGELDAAFARPGASEWDIAAADLILGEAGGKLTTLTGETLHYNRQITGAPALIAASVASHPSILELAKSSGILQ